MSGGRQAEERLARKRRRKVELRCEVVKTTISFQRDDHHWLVDLAASRSTSLSVVVGDAVACYRGEVLRALHLVEREARKAEIEAEKKKHAEYTTSRRNAPPMPESPVEL